MESWVGIKAVFLNGYPLFSFFIGFGLVKKMAKSQMALGLGWENSFSCFFSVREVSYPFISFQVYTLLSSGYWRFIEKKEGVGTFSI